MPAKRPIRLKRRNPVIAACITYRQLRALGHFDRRACIRMALIQFKMNRIGDPNK
jgi:hypothetical protein